MIWYLDQPSHLTRKVSFAWWPIIAIDDRSDRRARIWLRDYYVVDGYPTPFFHR